ncbi:MAG TPA: formate/nitrite transporter family protein, partial [Solirubrobacteraceae bacterium]|nr:formate/nitrite transporter family protein [Solirubrobacteraceae bacterium]
MAGQVESSRPGVDEIYARVREDASEELSRTPSALGFSGLFAGFTIGASALAYATALVYLDGGAALFVAALVYPIGYIGAILGRAQLFTENTLYPVLLLMGDRRYLPGTARLWGIVIVANLVGAVLFALVAVKTSALPDGVPQRIRSLGDEAVSRDVWVTFWAAVLAGWLLALVAWLVEAVNSPLGALFVVWALTMLVGLGSFDHSVATAVEAWAAVLEGDAEFGPALGWQGTTLLGNALGGVFIVTLINYAQVRSG